MLQHLIGLEPDLPNGRVTMRPMLLPWLNELCFDNLRLGRRSVGVRVWREGDRVRGEITGAEDLEVSVRTGT